MEHFVPIRYPTPESGNSAPDRPDYQQGGEHFDNPETERSKKRQKRNKPTLSCEECVGRKTKVCNIISISFKPSSVASKPGGVNLVLFQRPGFPESVFAAAIPLNFLRCISYMRTPLCSCSWIGNTDFMVQFHCMNMFYVNVDAEFCFVAIACSWGILQFANFSVHSAIGGVLTV